MDIGQKAVPYQLFAFGCVIDFSGTQLSHIEKEGVILPTLTYRRENGMRL